MSLMGRILFAHSARNLLDMITVTNPRVFCSSIVSTRAHARFVATEYGIAELFGKNLKQRAEALRDIAHPDHREDLNKAIHERFGGTLVTI